jgi:hypothetical protein
MRRILHNLVTLAVSVCTGLVCAQSMQVLTENTDRELVACIKPTSDSLPPLVYPPDELFLKKEATVRVRLTFDKPDKAPKAEVFYGDGRGVFNAEVLKRVERYRVPCFPADRTEPLVVTQEFYFDPRDGRPVIWNAPRANQPVSMPNSCSQKGLAEISYPMTALTERSGSWMKPKGPEYGVVLALITLQSASAPAQIKILHDAGSWVLAETVTDALKRAQMRCDRYPTSMIQEFHFQLEGTDRYGFKDMTLQAFAGAVMNLDARKVRFDFTTMACPFDVNLRLFQPHFENSAGEVGKSDPNRADFLDWLRGLSLRLPPESAKHLVGATTRISIPCGVLDLRE